MSALFNLWEVRPQTLRPQLAKPDMKKKKKKKKKREVIMKREEGKGKVIYLNKTA